jgi:hydroxypyruvate reductase
LPDPACEPGLEALLRLWNGAGPRDLILSAWTGGGSALLSRPASPIGWDELHRVTAGLLRSGAPIEEVNVARKHLCALTGG